MNAEELKALVDEREIEECQKQGIRLLTLADEDYPRLLREIYDPPQVLYLKGNLIQGDEAAMAIVGSRHPSFYGREQARRFARELAQSGLTIISGFAKGVDHEAHSGALDISHGRTIAVKGCGLDIDYPRGHQKLFDQIQERGAILSEYPLGTTPRAEFFPKRNRIISGMSLGTLVIEANERSGSLITAHEAVEQGREVFALPGPVTNATSRGTHSLIKEGAALTEFSYEIMEALAPSLFGRCSPLPSAEEKPSLPATRPAKPAAATKKTPTLSPNEEALLSAVRQAPLCQDEMMKSLELGGTNLSSLLLNLELKGLLKKGPDGRYARV